MRRVMMTVCLIVFAYLCQLVTAPAEKASESFKKSFRGPVGLQAPPAVKAPAPTMPPPLQPPLQELRKTGVVSVTKDAGGKVTHIKLITLGYDIVLNETSKPLESMEGQKVKVFFDKIEHQDDKYIMTTTSVEPGIDKDEAVPVNPNVAIIMPDEKAKIGIVSVTKDASGKVTGIKLNVGMYEIARDAASKSLENLDGKRVQLTGILMTQDGHRIFRVTPAKAAPAPK